MRILCAILLFVMASQASALSCMRANVAETFNRLQDSDIIYSIAVGKIKITSRIPKYIEGKPRKVSADFVARPLGLKGLQPQKTIPVTIQTHCVAHWCGGIPQDRNSEYLVFLRKSDSGDVIDVAACPEGILSISTDTHVDVLKRCLARGKCSAPDIKRMGRY